MFSRASFRPAGCKAGAWGACVFALLITASRADLVESSAPSIEVNAGVDEGAVNGFAQTPAGGKVGTSDIRRPTLDELNIDRAFIYNLSLSAQRPPYRVYLNAHAIRLSGDGTLRRPLITRQPFPAGTSFQADLQYDWYQLGVARWFGPAAGRFQWAPSLELALLDFDYHFKTPDDAVQRGYAKVAVRAGLEGSLALDGQTRLLASASASLPLDHMPQMASGQLLVQRAVLERENQFSAAVFAGIGALYIDYEDSQGLPNHIRFEAIPYFTVGLTVRM